MDFIIAYCEGGLANRFANLISCHALSKRLNRTLLVYWPRNFRCSLHLSEISNGYDFITDLCSITSVQVFGKQDSYITSLKIYNDPSLRSLHKNYGEYCNDYNFGIFNSLAQNLIIIDNWFPPSYILEDIQIRMAFEYWLKNMSHEILAEARVVVREMNLYEIDSYHVRLTDFNISNELRQSFLHKLTNSEKQLFVASDSRKFLEEAQEFPNIICFIHNSYPSKRALSLTWKNSAYTSSSSARAGLIDMLLLSHCKSLNSFQNSSFAEFARILSPIVRNDYSIS